MWLPFDRTTNIEIKLFPTVIIKQDASSVSNDFHRNMTLRIVYSVF